MDTSNNPILVSKMTKSCNIFERNDIISSAVVDESGKLLGRITVDDVLDVIREDADQNFLEWLEWQKIHLHPQAELQRAEFFG